MNFSYWLQMWMCFHLAPFVAIIPVMWGFQFQGQVDGIKCSVLWITESNFFFFFPPCLLSRCSVGFKRGKWQRLLKNVHFSSSINRPSVCVCVFCNSTRLGSALWTLFFTITFRRVCSFADRLFRPLACCKTQFGKCYVWLTLCPTLAIQIGAVSVISHGKGETLIICYWLPFTSMKIVCLI